MNAVRLKGIVKIFSINLVLFLLIIFFIEIFFGTRNNPSSPQSECKNCRSAIRHDKLGYWHTSNSSHTPRKTCGKDLCFKARYTYDEIGRRVTQPLNKKSKRHILLFGGSYVFGEGLRDEQTIAYKLQSKMNANVFNYARVGVGPPFSLAQFETNMIETNRGQGVGLYFLMEFHLSRISMNTGLPWLWTTQAYDICEHGDICSIGQMQNINLFYQKGFKTYNWLRKQITFIKRFGWEFDYRTESENIEIMGLVLKKIKKLYENRFAGKFYVVLFPNRYYPQEMLDNLSRNSIPVIKIKDSEIDWRQRQVCACDGHPSDVLTTFVADQLAGALKTRTQIFR